MKVDRDSYFKQLDSHIIKQNILSFLNCEELFSMREVCHEWKEYIKDLWPSLFAREINNQFQIQKLHSFIETEKQFMQIRAVVFQKCIQFIIIIIECIDYHQLALSFADNSISLQTKYLIYIIACLFGARLNIEDVSELADDHESLLWK